MSLDPTGEEWFAKTQITYPKKFVCDGGCETILTPEDEVYTKIKRLPNQQTETGGLYCFACASV